MKLLHTSDWHLGAKLGRVDRSDDQRAALAGLLEIARSEQPDLILHSGDLFDAPRPPYDAMQLGIEALRRLSELAPTVVLRGNHDSPALFRVLDQLVAAATPRGLWFVHEPAVLPFAGLAAHPVAVACIPFIPPSAVADFATDDPSHFEGSYADGIRSLNEEFLTRAEEAVGSKGYVLYAAHLHVHGARPARSERRITVGDDYAIHTHGLSRALYCAFGHIHDPQLLPGGVGNGHYAGSLVPLDFGEGKQTKQAVLVSIEHDVQVSVRDLPGGRPLVSFEGPPEQFEELAEAGQFDDAILKAQVISEDPMPGLADWLYETSPGCAVFEITNRITNQTVRAIEQVAAEGEECTDTELFREWRETAATSRTAPDDLVCRLFEEALTHRGEDTVPDLGVSALRSRVTSTLRALVSGKNQADY